MPHLGTWLSGVLSSALLKGALEDLGLSPPSCFCDCAMQRLSEGGCCEGQGPDPASPWQPTKPRRACPPPAASGALARLGAARRGRGARGPFQTGGRWAAARHEMAESDRAEAAAPRRAEEAAGQAPQPPPQQQPQPAPQQQTPQQPPQDEEAAAAAAGSGAGSANGVKMCVRAGPGGWRGQRGRGGGGRRWSDPPRPHGSSYAGPGPGPGGPSGRPRPGHGAGGGSGAAAAEGWACGAAPQGWAGLGWAPSPGSGTWRTRSHGIPAQECSHRC